MTDSTIEAQRDAAIARAERAEQMVAELRALAEVADKTRNGRYWVGNANALIDAALARTEPVAWRWVLATERDALRAEVERLKEALEGLRGVWGVEFRNGGWLGHQEQCSVGAADAREFTSYAEADAEARQWLLAGGMPKRLPTPPVRTIAALTPERR